MGLVKFATLSSIIVMGSVDMADKLFLRLELGQALSAPGRIGRVFQVRSLLRTPRQTQVRSRQRQMEDL